MASEWILERQKYEGVHILETGQTTIGRCQSAKVNCTSLYVSRNHCSIEFVEDVIKIKDNNSSNGTYINHTKIIPNMYHSLKANDIIGIGVDGTTIDDELYFVYKLILKTSVIVRPTSSIYKDIQLLTPKSEKKRPYSSSVNEPVEAKKMKITEEIKFEPSDDIMFNYTQTDNDVIEISEDEEDKERSDSMVQIFEKSFKSNMKLDNSGVNEGQNNSFLEANNISISDSDNDGEEVICLDSDNEELDGWINKLSQNCSVKREIMKRKEESDEDEHHELKIEVDNDAMLPLSQNLIKMIMEDESNEDVCDAVSNEPNRAIIDLDEFDFIGQSEEAPPAEILKPCSVKVPKMQFIKPPIIEAHVIQKRRSSEARPKEQPPKPKPKPEPPKTSDKSKSADKRERKRKRSRKSSKSLSSIVEKNEKEIICQIRKNRLKEIAEKATLNKEKSHDSSSKIASKPKVKFTENNRGAFLTDVIKKVPDKTEHRKKSSKDRESKTGHKELPKISSLPKIPKKTNKDDDSHGSFSNSVWSNNSSTTVPNHKVSDKDNLNISADSKPSHEKPRVSHGNKKVSHEPRTSSVDKRKESDTKTHKDSPRRKSTSCSSIVGKVSSSDVKRHSVDSHQPASTNENSKNIINIKEDDRSKTTHVATEKDKQGVEGVCESTPNKIETNGQIPSRTPVMKSCLKTPRSGTKIRRSVKIKMMPMIQYFEIEEGNRLNRTNVKDLPFNWQAPKKTTPVICSKDVKVKKVENIDSIIALITSWNPVWLDEQKDISQPPPLLVETSYKLAPMLHSYSNYSDYEKTVFPLLVMEFWASISKEWISRHQIPDQRKKTFSIAIDQTHPPPGQNMLPKTIMIMHTHMLLNKQDHDGNIHPREGDLIMIGLVATSGPLISPEARKASVRKRFALVTNTRKIVARDQVVHQGLLQYVKEPYAILYLELKTIHKNWNLDVKKVMGVYIISYVNPMIRNIKAIYSLPNSPLFNNVMNPNEKQFVKHKPDGKKYIDHTQQLGALNEAQEKAVMETVADCLLSQPMVSLIQGPPGTGKSRVIVSIIQQLLYGENLRPTNRPKILICAPSNAAIDEIVCRLLYIRQLTTANKFKMVRFGILESMNLKVRDISLQTFVDRDVAKQIADMNYNDMDSLETEKRFLEAKCNSLKLCIENAVKSNKNTHVLQDKLAKCERKLGILQTGASKVPHGQLMQMKRESQRLILSGADIICTTLASCVNGQMSSSNIYFNICIVDEATQCTEPDTLMPLMLGISKLILVGDPQQLPATVISHQSKSYGFQRSLFSRIESCLEHTADNPIRKLKIQYRMHPEICHWPNSYFYQGNLESAMDSNDRNTLLPYTVFGLSYMQSPNFSNAKEADFVISLATTVVKLTANLKYTIGIVTPYQCQRTCIVNKLKHWSSCFQNRFCDANTIDSIQGQERDVIIISLVRTDGVGFLADFERLNVALTRARHSLFVCGNFSSLKNNQMWSAFIKDAKDRKCFRDAQNLSTKNYDKFLHLIAKNP